MANYLRVVALVKKGERIAGARVCDLESGKEFPLHARVVINATGVWRYLISKHDPKE